MNKLPALMLLALLFAALASCDGVTPGSAPEETRPERQAPLVRATTPRLQTLDRKLEITAEVNILRESEVQARLAGLEILQIAVDVGDPVEAGQLVALLERTTLEEAVREKELDLEDGGIRLRDAELAVRELEAEHEAHATTLAQKRRVLDRARAQAEKGAIADQDLETAQYDLDTEVARDVQLALKVEKAEVARDLAAQAVKRSELNLARARRELGYTRVLAPFAGIVSERLANPRELTSINKPLVRIFDPKSMVVEAHVPQQEMHLVRAGLGVRVTTKALLDHPFSGRVALVSPTVDRDSGTLMVRLTLDDQELLRPGLFVSGHIILETRPDVLTVARKAVAYERERPFVYRIVPADAASAEESAEGAPAAPWRVERVYFREGLSAADSVQFIPLDPESTLDANTYIVLVGLDRLREGDAVRLEERAEAQISSVADLKATSEGS